MKLRKIKSIKNIGSFTGFQADNSESSSLCDFNIFFGENGTGKTTLATIISSLNSNNPNLILQKELSGCDGDQYCILECEDCNYIFKKNQWVRNGQSLTGSTGNFLLFNKQFVEKNLFTDRVEHEQGVNLHKVIFGEKGITLNEELRNIKQEIEALKIEIGINTLPKIREIYNFPENKLDSTSEKLREIDKQIRNTNAKQDLLQSNQLELLSEILINTEELITCLSKDLDSHSHQMAKQKVQEYKKEFFLHPQEYESFVLTGLHNIKDENCPFCHNVIGSSEVIETYKCYFDNIYAELKTRLTNAIDEFLTFNLPLKINQLVLKVNQNIERLTIFKDKVDVSELSTLEFDGLTLLKDSLDKELKLKRENLNYPLDIKKISTFQEALKDVNNNIYKLNSIIASNNLIINKFKSGLATLELASLNAEKKEAILVVERFGSKRDLFDRIIKLDKENVTKKEELEAYSQKVSEDYKNIINKHLIDFGFSHIQLEGINSIKKSFANEVNTEVKLNVSNHIIDMRSNSDISPAFNNTLSDGEKNALAFAFFMCQLEKTPSLEEAIVVFDDPLNSIDDSRKIDTALQLKDLNDKVSQLIILTHKDSFLKILYDQNKDSAKFFKLQKDARGTQILPLDMQEYLKSEHQKISERLYKFTEEDFEYPHLKNDLRKFFEGIISTKYPLEIINIRGTLMTYSSLETLFWSKGKLLDIKDSLLMICDISNEGSHSETTPSTIYSTMGYTAKKNLVIKAFALVERI